MKNNKNGFAISGILYPLLILTLFLVVQMLFMLQTRKNVLDKSRTELSDSINGSNTVYTNEELSILLEQYKVDTDKKVATLKADYEAKIASLDSKNHPSTEKSFFVKKMLKSSNYNPTKIIITNFDGPIYLEMKAYGQYAYINYGGYVEYKLGAFNAGTSLHGLGSSIDKQGDMGNLITSVTPTFSNGTLTLNINFSNYINENGSEIYFNMKLYSGYTIRTNTTVTIQ